MTRLIATLTLLVTATTCQSALIFVTGADGSSNVNIAEGTASTDIFIRIQGQSTDTTANEIAAFNYTFILGDGGPLVGGSDVVAIEAVTYTGTGTGREASVWDGVSGLESEVLPNTLPQNSAGIFSVNVDMAGENGLFDPTVGGLLTDLAGPTVLAKLTLDTSALIAGDSFGLTVFSTFGAPTGERFVSASGGGFETEPLAIVNGGNGTLTVSAASASGSATAVPEASTVVSWGLMCVTGLGLAWRRRRRP